MTGLVLMVAALVSAAESKFTLRLKELSWSQLDAHTQARRSRWNSSMGRLMYEMGQQQATLMRGGQPGGSGGVALRMSLRRGLAPALVAASTDSGIELAESRVLVVRWPWEEEVDRPALPLDEQIAVLLGRRLEVR
jgi:hypothetical protein